LKKTKLSARDPAGGGKFFTKENLEGTRGKGPRESAGEKRGKSDMRTNAQGTAGGCMGRERKEGKRALTECMRSRKKWKKEDIRSGKGQKKNGSMWARKKSMSASVSGGGKRDGALFAQRK